MTQNSVERLEFLTCCSIPSTPESFCGLFDDSVSIANYRAPNGKMTDEWWSEKNSEVQKGIHGKLHSGQRPGRDSNQIPHNTSLENYHCTINTEYKPPNHILNTCCVLKWQMAFRCTEVRQQCLPHLFPSPSSVHYVRQRIKLQCCSLHTVSFQYLQWELWLYTMVRGLLFVLKHVLTLFLCSC